MATKRKKQEYNVEPRVMFNRGFHDGALEQHRYGGESPIRAAGWRERFAVYATGYNYGQRWQREGRYVDGKTLSTVAWNEYRIAKRGAVRAPETYEVDAVDEANAICDAWEREKESRQ
jgi:hypothetical protein